MILKTWNSEFIGFSCNQLYTYIYISRVYSFVFILSIFHWGNIVKMEGLKKDRMEGGCACSSGVVCRRGLKYSARYVKVKGDWYATTRDAESMSFYYFFIPFMLKRKLSQWSKIVMPDLNDFLDFNRNQKGKWNNSWCHELPWINLQM